MLILTVMIGVLGLTGIVGIPLGLRHWLHLLTRPNDLYEPIVTDRFAFHEPGYSATYVLAPKYLDYYELGFRSGPDGIPSSYRFGGSLRAEFLDGDRLLEERDASSAVSTTYARGDEQRIAAVALMTFPLPMQGVHEGLSLRLTVVRADPVLAPLQDAIELYVKVSGVP